MKKLFKALLASFLLSSFSYSQSELGPVLRVVFSADTVQGNWNTLSRGKRTLKLRVFDRNSQALLGATVQLKYKMTEMEMRIPEAKVKEVSEGNYTSDINISMSGLWAFDLSIVKNGDIDTLHKEIEIK